MMTLFVFYVLIFGLFGVVANQYMLQYREAYGLWIREIVYNDHQEYNINEKREICSKVESLSREICTLANMVFLVIVMLCFIFLIIIYTITENLPLTTDKKEINILYASLLLSIMILVAFPIILYLLKLNLFNKSETSTIDEKLFDLWYKIKCPRSKRDGYRYKTEPRQLYEILAEKIDNGDIKASEEESRIVKGLLRKKDVNLHP